jgi:hypothetical protein
MFTDAAGNNEKARPCLFGSDRRRAVVSTEFKPTGASADNTRASLTSTQSGLSDALKLASSLSLGPPINASNGADNEHNVSTETDSDNRRSH